MGETPRALGPLARPLEEVIGVEDAADVVDPFASIDWVGLDDRVRRLERRFDHLEARFEHLEARIGRLEDRVDQIETEMRTSFRELRRDLLRVTGAQFLALVGAVAALVGLG